MFPGFSKKMTVYKPLVFAGGIILIILLGIFDYYTGIETPLSIFYLVPITLATWMLNARIGCSFCLLSTLSYLISTLRWQHDFVKPLTPYTNSLSRLIFFLLVCFIISKLKTFLMQEMILARTDALTGAANRRYFYEKSQEILDQARLKQSPITLAYLDIDDFKTFNDLWGHQEGDSILALVTGTISSNLRKTDILARLGGDEFAILLPDTDQHDARIVLDKIRSKLLNPSRIGDVRITLSFGAVTFSTLPANMDTLVSQADRLMYQVKKSGKNSILYQEI